MLSKYKTHSWEICFFLAVFVSMFVFFTGVHRLVIYDGDDWVNLSQMRHFIPMWHGFNPIKILPETLMPLVGYVSGYVITPFTGNYVDAVTLASALLVSGLITLYIYLFGQFIGVLDGIHRYRNAVVCWIVLLMHFWIFKQRDGLSYYLFWAPNLTCYYHYMIPAIMNISLVLYLFRHEENNIVVWTESTAINGLLTMALFLSIFSNILQNIILAAFIGVLLLEKEGKKLFFPKHWKRIFIENWIYSTILIVWLISLFFEASGGRAKGIATSGFISPVLDTVKIFVLSLHQVNPVFFTLSLLVIFFALYTAHRKKCAYGENVFRIIRLSFMSMIIVSIYLVLVCAKASPSYISRSDVEIGIFFWYILIFGVSLSYLLQVYPRWVLATPFITMFILVEVMNGQSSFRENNIPGISPSICYAVDMDILNQIQSVDQSERNELELHVPKGDNRDNWPHPNYMGGNISQTLYRNGIISRPLKITIVPDTDMNKKYHLPVPR